MGSVLSLAGLSNGSTYQPSAAPIVNTTDPTQVANAYTGTQNSLTSQQNLLNALQGQNGLGNQSQVYNQLQGVANGTGPNPALAQLNQTTGQNVANQGALMAGQRGAAANVGLMARQAAQTGAGIQQTAAGQAATNQATQQLNAINAAGSMANTQASNQVAATTANTQAQEAEQSNLLGAQNNYNSNLVSSQNNVNSVQGSLANTSMKGQQDIVGGLMNAAGPALSSAGSWLGNAGSSLMGWMGNGLQTVGGGMAGAGEAIGTGSETLAPAAADVGEGAAMVAAKGGDVDPKNFAGGGEEFNDPTANSITSMTTPMQPVAVQSDPFSPQSSFVNFLKGFGQNQAPAATAVAQTPQAKQESGSSALQTGASSLGKGLVDALAKGGMPSDFRGGGKVNAKDSQQKATVSGNSYANDKIPAILSEHEIVLPRNVTMSSDPVGNSAKFVASVIAKRQAGGRR